MMLKKPVLNRDVTRYMLSSKIALPLPFFILVCVLTLFIGIALGFFGYYLLGVVIALVGIYCVIIFRQDELAAVLVIAAHLYFDWYLAFRVVGLIMTCTLLLLFFLQRSHRFPWVEPRFLILWFLFLILTIVPSIRGAFTLYDALYYYPNIVVSSFVMFWLGMVVSRDDAHLRHFFQILTILATLLAIHTLIEVTTGIVLFSTSHYDALIYSASNQVAGSIVHRAESFFIDPNWNGTFMAMMLFIPFGLLVECKFLFEKVLYGISLLLILLALLSTYSNGAWVGAFFGLLAFLVFIGSTRYRLVIIAFIIMFMGVLVLGFSSQLNLQLQHASDPQEVSLRVGAWQTALYVIQAFPLSGIGLGQYAYLARAEPYRVPAQFVPLAHPHNSYLELAAMGGIPISILFMLLLITSLWLTWQNWLAARLQTRFLLAGGIATIVALTINSISINGWTLPPIAAVGWMVLGTISSPLLQKSFSSRL